MATDIQKVNVDTRKQVIYNLTHKKNKASQYEVLPTKYCKAYRDNSQSYYFLLYPYFKAFIAVLQHLK